MLVCTARLLKPSRTQFRSSSQSETTAEKNEKNCVLFLKYKFAKLQKKKKKNFDFIRYYFFKFFFLCGLNTNDMHLRQYINFNEQKITSTTARLSKKDKTPH